MTPSQLSHELRETTSPDLERRRWIIGLSFLGIAAAKIVGLYQTGIVRRLPDLPLPGIDSNKVNASDYAYKRAQTPDAFFMLASYAITAWLAAAGGKNRVAQNPALPVALGLKTLADTAVAAELGREEWQDNKALCAYCQAATLVSLASVVLALPEALRAGRRIFGREDAGFSLAKPALDCGASPRRFSHARVAWSGTEHCQAGREQSGAGTHCSPPRCARKPSATARPGARAPFSSRRLR